ncbi:MAG: O-antigen ligase family protein, partial [Clostridium sp.]|uniref:O-antigen ligase family protein n=1 Tax=Clostridium sp. TaxID=1506 RepID=UPI003F2A2840
SGLLTIIGSIYMSINIRSSSGIIAIIFVSSYMIFMNFKNWTKIIRFKSMLVAYVLFYYGIVILKIQYIFSDFIIEVLGKDLTFTGRVELWEVAKELIKNNSIKGIGTQSTTNLIYSAKQGKYLSSHNQILQNIIENGIIIIPTIIIIFFIVNKVIEKDKEIELIASIGMVGMLIILFSEAMGFFDIYVLASITYSIGTMKIDKHN